jgi:hypothetical protein
MSDNFRKTRMMRQWRNDHEEIMGNLLAWQNMPIGCITGEVLPHYPGCDDQVRFNVARVPKDWIVTTIVNNEDGTHAISSVFVPRGLDEITQL